MKAIFTTIAGPVVIAAAWVAVSSAQTTCPPEVASARAMLTARGGEAQASLSQSPRGQRVQAARSQDVQAPRNQDVQAPRSQDVQAPRSQSGTGSTDAGRNSINEPQSARALVVEAEAACQAGNNAQARQKALEALDIMKQ